MITRNFVLAGKMSRILNLKILKMTAFSTLCLLEIHGDEVRHSIADAKVGVVEAFSLLLPKERGARRFRRPYQALHPQRRSWLAFGTKTEDWRWRHHSLGCRKPAKRRLGEGWWNEEDETKRWQSLIKAAKPNSKKILSFLGYKPAPSPSSRSRRSSRPSCPCFPFFFPFVAVAIVVLRQLIIGSLGILFCNAHVNTQNELIECYLCRVIDVEIFFPVGFWQLYRSLFFDALPAASYSRKNFRWCRVYWRFFECWSQNSILKELRLATSGDEEASTYNNTTRKVLIDNVSKSSAKGYFSSPMGLTRRYGFCCRNCVRQSPTTIFSVRRAWAPFRHGKSDRCRSVSGSPLTADVMQTDTWQTPLTGS